MTEPIWDQLAAIGESKPDAWDELPPLPTRSCIVTFLGDGHGLHYTLGVESGLKLMEGQPGAMLDLFTADQIRARDAMWAERLASAVARERARCSDICDQNASCEGIAQKCAAAIRRG